MDAERKLAERFREYANGKMVEGSDLARAAAYLEKLAAEIERLQAALTLIDNMELATHEMTLAHQMGQIAREALSSE